MNKILIIEDEEAIADLEKDYLELSGFQVEIEHEGDKGLERAVSSDYDLIILDLMLPGMDGFEICRRIRDEKNIPILMVSAKKDDIDKIRGLGLGADDYMTKPFSPSELVARVKAHLARYTRLVSSQQKTNDIVEIRGIRIDKTARRVYINGEEKAFTTKEFDLLTFLAEIPIMCLPRKNCSGKSGIWILSGISLPLRCILRKSGRRLRRIRQIPSILKRFGELGIGLRCKVRPKSFAIMGSWVPV